MSRAVARRIPPSLIGHVWVAIAVAKLGGGRVADAGAVAERGGGTRWRNAVADAVADSATNAVA
ncbi:MAG: hypothetical protein RLO54_42185, partial [Sandaracinaceae bacterium]